MKVQEKYYNLLKSGIKTIELRLYDEKQKKIKKGDNLLFENLENPKDTFIGTVINLHLAPDFKDLTKKIPIQKTGFKNAAELINTMEIFYPLEKQKEIGVFGIEIKILK